MCWSAPLGSLVFGIIDISKIQGAANSWLSGTGGEGAVGQKRDISGRAVAFWATRSLQSVTPPEPA